MERSFIATKESKYAQELNEYIKLTKQQREFVKEFFIEKGIEANCFIVRGNGFMNIPFNEYDKKDICLSIEATENDLTKFGKTLCKPSDGLYTFKKSSSIAKEFANECIDKRVVINLWSPRVSDYFKSLGHRGLSYSQFENEDVLYIKVDSEYLKEDDIPEGFVEIKTSDFYIAKEEYESLKGK